MTRTTPFLGALFALLVSACGQDHRPPLPPVDCSVEENYYFENIENFTADTGWYFYSDPTPGGAPNAVPGEDSNVPTADIPAPGRCGDFKMMKLEMHGKNFWGAGFADWRHNAEGSRVDGSEFEGISFWARSPINFEKVFLFRVDDTSTIVNAPADEGLIPIPSDGGVADAGVYNPCGTLPQAGPTDDDLDGDGCLGPGDRVSGTHCRLPPPNEFGQVECYGGGIEPPASVGVRVPEPDECGNQFHTRITTTEAWQLFLIPWDELVQWPCPNRLPGGIDKSEIARFEIKLSAGMQYEIWIDNIALYRSLGN